VNVVRKYTGIVDVADPKTWRGRDTLAVNMEGPCSNLPKDYVFVSQGDRTWLPLAREYFKVPLYIAGLL